jgi:hypothetical protein
MTPVTGNPMTPLTIFVALPVPLLMIWPDRLSAPEAVIAPGVPVVAVLCRIRLPRKLGTAENVMAPALVL